MRSSADERDGVRSAAPGVPEWVGRQLKAAGQVPAQAGYVGRGGTACQFFHTAFGQCFHDNAKQGGSKPSLASIAAHGEPHERWGCRGWHEHHRADALLVDGDHVQAGGLQAALDGDVASG